LSSSENRISRKDFLNGMAMTIGVLAAGCPMAARAQEKGPDKSAREDFLEKGITEKDPRYYPPGLGGMRGSHPGSFEAGHMLRDGERWDNPTSAKEMGENYDLIIVGAGISGLAAAHFYRKRMGDKARILILDNHDDFGGHAKRNEFEVDGRKLIGYGGTQAIEGIPHWGPEAKGLLADIGIDIGKFYIYFDQEHRKKWQLTDSCFFDKETFGSDKLAPDQVGTYMSIDELNPANLLRFLEGTPLSSKAREDMMRLNFGTDDPLPAMSKDEKIAFVKKTSCRDFLEKYCKVDTSVVDYLNGRLFGIRAVGLEAIDAYLGGLITAPGIMKAMGLSRSFGGSEPYIFHFPDGNASIARLLVRSMVPGSAPGSTMEDIVQAQMDYGALDRPGNAVRIRLNSTVVRVRNIGIPSQSKGVEVNYARDGVAYRVRGAHAVLACWNMIIPYMCPEMPQSQRDGLSYNVKVPLVYGTVAISNWKAFQRLRAGTIYAPSCFWSEIYVDFPVSMGGYEHSKTPEEPVLLHLVRTPRMSGLPMKDQYRAGRAELFSMTFETFEQKTREQLDRILGPGGFVSRRDIAAITINRWPHGYSYMASPLWDPAWAKGQEPFVIGRQPFGRITIANADAGGLAESYVSIDQAHRAIDEVMAIVAA
jgi:spermidine dehydrogenase